MAIEISRTLMTRFFTVQNKRPSLRYRLCSSLTFLSHDEGVCVCEVMACWLPYLIPRLLVAWSQTQSIFEAEENFPEGLHRATTLPTLPSTYRVQTKNVRHQLVRIPAALVHFST